MSMRASCGETSCAASAAAAVAAAAAAAACTASSLQHHAPFTSSSPCMRLASYVPGGPFGTGAIVEPIAASAPPPPPTPAGHLGKQGHQDPPRVTARHAGPRRECAMHEEEMKASTGAAVCWPSAGLARPRRRISLRQLHTALRTLGAGRVASDTGLRLARHARGVLGARPAHGGACMQEARVSHGARP